MALVLAWAAVNLVLFAYFLWHLSWSAVLVKAERGWNEFFRHEGARGYTTMLALPIVSGITGGLFGAVLSDLLTSFKNPELFRGNDLVLTGMVWIVTLIFALAVPMWLLNSARKSAGLSIPAQIHSLSMKPFTEYEKEDLVRQMDKQVEKMVKDLGKGRPPFVLMLLVGIGLDIYCTGFVADQHGRWMLVLLISIVAVTAALSARSLLRPRWMNRRRIDLVSFGPEILELVPRSEESDRRTTDHHHHYYRAGRRLSALSIGIGVGGIVVWALTRQSRTQRDS